MFTCHGGKICDAAKPLENAVITTGTATLVQLNIFKQRSQCRCHFLCLREFYGFFLDLLSCNVIEGFHGETEFAVLDGNDFYFDFIADCQDCGWMFDSFGANLGDVDEAGEAVSEVDECAVWLQAFNGSFGNKADFYVGNFLFALFVCFLAERIRRSFSLSRSKT